MMNWYGLRYILRHQWWCLRLRRWDVAKDYHDILFAKWGWLYLLKSDIRPPKDPHDRIWTPKHSVEVTARWLDRGYAFKKAKAEWLASGRRSA